MAAALDRDILGGETLLQPSTFHAYKQLILKQVSDNETNAQTISHT